MVFELLLQALALSRQNTALRCWSHWWWQHFHFIERRIYHLELMGLHRLCRCIAITLLGTAITSSLIVILRFYPNVTVLHSGIMLSQIRRLSAVYNVCAPYTKPIEIFGNVSTPFCISAIRWPPCKILQFNGDRPRGTLLSGAKNAKGIARYSDLGHVEGYLGNSAI